MMAKKRSASKPMSSQRRLAASQRQHNRLCDAAARSGNLQSYYYHTDVLNWQASLGKIISRQKKSELWADAGQAAKGVRVIRRGSR